MTSYKYINLLLKHPDIQLGLEEYEKGEIRLYNIELEFDAFLLWHYAIKILS